MTSGQPRTQEQRLAENEAIFRRANEQLAGRLQEIAPTLESYPFICECGDPHCTQIVNLTLDEYREIRARPDRFLMVPGHDALGEKVVRSAERFEVVEKQGDARRAVDEYDRRHR
jgi:hypothetical protein